MESSQPATVTRLLARAREGDREALDEVFPIVYDVLHQLSRRELRRMAAGDTLCTTDLIHEAYLKLSPGTGIAWNDRVHFYRIAARAMRQALIDRARRRSTERRKEERLRLTVTGASPHVRVPWEELLSLDEALTKLGDLSERLHSVVELRFFGGLSEDEVAGVLGVSTRTVRRDWTKARLFLHREIYPEQEPA